MDEREEEAVGGLVVVCLEAKPDGGGGMVVGGRGGGGGVVVEGRQREGGGWEGRSLAPPGRTAAWPHGRTGHTTPLCANSSRITLVHHFRDPDQPLTHTAVTLASLGLRSLSPARDFITRPVPLSLPPASDSYHLPNHRSDRNKV